MYLQYALMIPLGRQSDTLVHHTDMQTVLNVGLVVTPRGELAEIHGLRMLEASQFRFVTQQGAYFREAQQMVVEHFRQLPAMRFQHGMQGFEQFVVTLIKRQESLSPGDLGSIDADLGPQGICSGHGQICFTRMFSVWMR